MTRTSAITLRTRAAIAALLLLAISVALSCSSGGDAGSEQQPRASSEPTETVNVVYVVEVSWFATGPDTVRRNVERAAQHMQSCSESEQRSCKVMTFAADGALVAGKRVPASLRNDPDTGYWYSLDAQVDTDRPTIRAAALASRVQQYASEVTEEIVPPSYPEQTKGCVNLVETFDSALGAIERNPADRNVIVLFVSGLSNCVTQAFYPDRPFPAADEAAASVLAAVPPGSGVVDGRPVCVEWDPMFGQAYIEQDYYISQEQREVLKDAWTTVLDEWGAVGGNTPGEQLGDCLVREVEPS